MARTGQFAPVVGGNASDDDVSYAQISTVNGVTLLVGADGTEYAALPVVGENVVANVNHRTGNQADLLLLTGGNGEIAVAQDTKALVIYGGSPLDAVPLRTAAHGIVIASFGAFGQSCSPGTTTLSPTETADSAAIYAAPSITLPTGYAIVYSVNLTFTGTTAGAARWVILNGAVVGQVDGVSFPAADLKISHSFATGIPDDWSIQFTHNEASAVTVKGNVSAVLYRI